MKTYALFLSLILTVLFVGCSPQSPTATTTEAPGKATQAEASQGTGGGLGPMTADTSAIKNKHEGIRYGTLSEAQYLNIYLPESPTNPLPVIVSIHGGAFMLGSAEGSDLTPALEGLNRGYAVVSVNYRLSGEATFPAAVSDCKSAIRYIKAHANEYGLDPDRVAVWGGSAGGNLAAMMGTSYMVDALDGENKENPEADSSVRAVVDWFGPIDFLKMDEQFESSGITPKMGKTSVESSPESKYIGQLITSAPELTAQANPSTYISSMDPSTAPAFLIQHGDQDANVPLQQSVDFASQLKEALGEDKVTFEVIKGAGHGTSEFTESTNLEKVFEFLDSNLK